MLICKVLLASVKEKTLNFSSKATKDQVAAETTLCQIKNQALHPTIQTDSFLGKLKQELPKWMLRIHKR
jgi:hypothetical protein